MSENMALGVDGRPILIKEREDEILVARMNRPERMNAMGGGLPEALSQTWLEFRDDPTLKVMIITGVGDRAFSAGADLRQNDERARALGAESGEALLSARDRPGLGVDFRANNLKLYKPVIAAINGWCVAGGCEMALACDIRIVEAHAMMGLPEAKRGMGAKPTTHKLHFLTYLGAGLDIEWTGDPITAEHAVAIGWANELVPTGQSVERALEVARHIVRHPVSYLEYHKERMYQSLGVPLEYALRTEQRLRPDQPEGER